MLSRQSIQKMFVLALALALLLTACERPLQNVATEAYPGPADGVATTEPTVEAPVGPETTATAIGEAPATEAPATEPAATEPAPTQAATATAEAGEDESPRPDDEEATPEATAGPTVEATPEPTAEATPEGEDEQPPADDGAAEERVHVVQAGENLYRIGLQYGISWTVLAEYNTIANANDLEVGQQLRIPPAGSAPGATATSAPQVTHVVQPGETLGIIAQQYGVAWPDIAQANGLAPPYIIHAGQSLVIPGGG